MLGKNVCDDSVFVLMKQISLKMFIKLLIETLEKVAVQAHVHSI
jgi:hypothetical protein